MRGWIFLILLGCQAAPEPAPDPASGATQPVVPGAIEPDPDSAVVAPDTAVTFVYECMDGFSYTAVVRPDTTWIYLKDRVLPLGHTWSASGARFDDGQNSFWSRADEAVLELNGKAHMGCRNNVARAIWEHAARSGVDFRALGQEPGWLLEIRDGQRVTLLADYGERRIETPAPLPKVNSATGETIYDIRTEAHRLEIRLRNRPCEDVMSGERYPTSVEFTLDGRKYTGCGRVLH